MSAHVLLNLLNELGKRDKMRGLNFDMSQSDVAYKIKCIRIVVYRFY